VRGGARPIVLVLPGILGSTLSDTADDGYGLIWVDPLGFIRGELAELKLTTEGDDADPAVRIAATDLLPLYYGDLIETLNDRGFDARPHYFDWRRELCPNCAQLRRIPDHSSTLQRTMPLGASCSTSNSYAHLHGPGNRTENPRAHSSTLLITPAHS
jgi:hypothetical protein